MRGAQGGPPGSLVPDSAPFVTHVDDSRAVMVPQGSNDALAAISNVEGIRDDNILNKTSRR